ncbi:MAG: low molecular weight phosphotyrosine protein phosphatase [Azoarcus sp.]|jgi:protein-tyrosine phosphatase|nr:low molecular weight phosphotyrosine protein phosphatase [Azoarcus sp.]
MAKKEKYRVLFVCSGNICRSPAAEGIALHHFELYGLDERFEVDSAGLMGDNFAGQPPDRRMLKAAAARGYNFAKLRARALVPADYGRFDLILAMDKGVLAEMREECPEQHLPRLRLFLDFAPDTKMREVPDPYYGAFNAFEQALDLCEAGVFGLMRALTAQAQ